MMDAVVPRWAVVAASCEDVAVPLFPEEAALLTRAVDKRRREFTTVRGLARRALGQLGVPPAALLPGPKGEPRWPAGVLGSMTHCDGYRAAVVARTADALSLGIDAEPNEPVPDGVLEAVSVGEEAERVAKLRARMPEVSWDRLLFSAKEAVYKTWFPLTGRWLGFEDADITFDVDGGSFRARLLVPGPDLPGHGPVGGFVGRWAAGDGLVVTAIAIPAGDGAAGAVLPAPPAQGAEQSGR